MEDEIKVLLIAFLGPTLSFILLGLIISNIILVQIGIGYLMLWLIFLAYIVRFMVIFNNLYARYQGQKIKEIASVEYIDIPIGGGKFLKGDIIRSTVTPKKDAPVIVMCHGLGGSRKDYYLIAAALVFRGYAWFSYDSRGHGDSSNIGEKSDSLYIIKDFKHVLDYIENRDDLSHTRIVALGASMGSSIVLNRGYLDPRIDFCVGICAWADFQKTATRELHGFKERFIKLGYKLMGINLDPSNLQNRMVSPILYSFNRRYGFFEHPVPWEVDNEYRVVLAHCEDDAVINYDNFKMNVKYLQLPPSNYVHFKRGDHAFAGMETALIGKMIYWLESRGY
jgi:pimeloyl-ACP methyl ester carboxylesterase